MSSSPPLGPPSPGPPPPGPPPPGPPPPMGSTPANPPPSPPPPSANTVSSITSANYFFGFVITFVVLLLLFVGCGIGSWRRFRLVGTAWDDRLQDMDGAPYVPARKRGRRRLVRPVFAEAWTKPDALRELAPGALTGEDKWDGVQPIAAAFVWSRSTLSAFARRVKASQRRQGNGPTQTLAVTLRALMLPAGPQCERPPRPPPIPRPPPEAIQIAVMIAMPSSPELKLYARQRTETSGERCVGHAGVGEYQIGVVRIPWPSGDGL